MGAGAVIGGLITASSGGPTPRRLVAVMAGFGTVIIALSVMPSIVLACIVMPFVGAGSVAVIALSNATLQLNSTSALRGRVMSLFAVALMGSTPIGGPTIGAIAEHTNPRVALAVGGIVALAAATYGWRHIPTDLSGVRHQTDHARLTAAT